MICASCAYARASKACRIGASEGAAVGASDGATVGASDGVLVGASVGVVGLGVGDRVGAVGAVGLGVEAPTHGHSLRYLSFDGDSLHRPNVPK